MQIPTGGGDFVGIDPAKLGEMVKSIESRTGGSGGADDAGILHSQWLSKAQKLGLDTARLTTIGHHLAWAQDQLPMLKRRHKLSLDADRRNSGHGSGMTPVGAGDLGKFSTEAAARKAARDDAKDYHDGKLTLQEYLKKLEPYANDPDYSAAAAGALGEGDLANLERGAATYDPENPTSGRFVLATTLATAMRNGVHFKDHTGHENIQLLAPLLTYAHFPKDALVDLGDQAMAPGNAQYADEVWKGLGMNAGASTDFLAKHRKNLANWLQAGAGHSGLPASQAAAFADVLKSGTSGGPGAGINVAAANATSLVKYFGTHPNSHAAGPTEAAFADIVMNYWPDVQAAIADPAPTGHNGPGHVSVDDETWKAFIHESMRNPKASALLLAYTHAKADELTLSDSANNPWAENTAGKMSRAFDDQAVKVYEELGQSDADSAKRWYTQAMTLTNTAILHGVNAVVDPGAAVAAFTKAGFTEVGKFFAGLTSQPSGENKHRPPERDSWRNAWAASAAKEYQKNDRVGDPQGYADALSGGRPFLTPEGRLVPGADAKQQEAYNAWLKDPETANALDARFRRRIDGYQD